MSKIKSEQELLSYFSNNKIDFIIQEYIGLPVELSVMYHRIPDARRGRVTSLCIKETMKVQGDGKSTIEGLMVSSARAKLQLKRFKRQFSDLLKNIPERGKVVELEPIGNHCLGTMFLNGNHFIDEKLELIFDQIGMQMDDMYYGRFDLKCNSIKALKNGLGFKLMEYNGIGAEPSHIYDPSYPLFKKYKDVYKHWKIIYKIYKIQKNKGVKAMGLGEAIQRFKIYSNYQKSLNL